MQFQKTITIQASSHLIFEQYKDVSHWSAWDNDVASASLDEDFEVGHTGLLKPRSGPQSRFVLTEVTVNQSFTTVTKLPLCAIIFDHHLEPVQGATMVTHRVSFTGILSFIFVHLIGSSIKKGLPHALLGLKSLCEREAAKNEVLS